MVDRQLRILAVGPGRSRHLMRWARRLADRGHDVHVVSDRLTTRPNELDGITAYVYTDLDPLLKVRGVRRFRLAGALRGLATELRPDIVHSHYLLPYGYFAAQAGVQPLVVSPWGREALVDAWQTRRAHRRAEAALAPGQRFVVNSGALEEASVRLGADPGRVRRILWHANIDEFAPQRADRPGLRARFGWTDDTPVVLSIKNFRSYKNVDVLVRAFARALREEPAARLLMTAGEGPDRASTESVIRGLDLAERVAIHEFTAAEMPVVLASVDLVAMLSEVESSPASLLESMASGVAVVAGKAPSMDEWVRQGEGAELVGCRNVEAVAEAMIKLIRDPVLRRRYGERNVREVRARFGDPGAELENVYRELVPA